MPVIGNALKPITVKLSDVLLDPNNPRFADLGEDPNPVAEGRYADKRVQEIAFNKMRRDEFNVSELKDTISTLGLLPMDRIVVRKWGDSNPQKYVVIEGNRRVTALKWLLQLQEEGKKDFSEEQLNNFSEFECLLLDTDIAPANAVTILPGLRHVSGIKEWGPYQKAKAIFALRSSGESQKTIAESLGLSVRAANALYRSYIALETMKANEEYSSKAHPELFSYFEEAYKRPEVRTWLGWDDQTERFTDEAKLTEFYSWIVSGPEGQEKKIPRAIDVRDFGKLLTNKDAMQIFRSAEGTLIQALATQKSEEPKKWLPNVTSAIAAIKNIPVDILKEVDQEGLQALTELRDIIVERLRDRERLIQG